VTNGVFRRFARRTAAKGGLFALSRELTSGYPRVLMYHNFCAEPAAPGSRTSAPSFRRQLEYVRRHFQPIRLRDLGHQLAAGTLPARAVAITIDDGHANFVRHALPHLEALRIPATFFVVSDLANSGFWLWEDKRFYVCERAPSTGSNDAAPNLDDLRHMPAEDRDRCLAAFAKRRGVRLPERPPEPFELVSWQDLERLARIELVDIGSHSRTHRLLADAGADDSWDEIDGSRRELEGRLQVEIASFCFPTGRPSDYRPEHVEMVARAGYVCATAAHPGLVTAESNRFALPRLGGVFHDLSRFRQELDGVEHLRQRFAGKGSA